MLAELTAAARRLALVGLAKNTGKTETLTVLLAELQAAGGPVGVTSVGRDGEEHDVIDARISKPRLRLESGSLVASTDELLRASGLEYELLEDTDARTPLGRVLIVRLRESGAVEVAGPSAAAHVRAVADAMLALGAERVLIDGAIDRRAASSPEVSDAVVVATGAVLSGQIEEVVEHTREALALLRMPTLDADSPAARRAHELAGTTVALGAVHGRAFLIDEQGEDRTLAERFALRAEVSEIERALVASTQTRILLIEGAVPERFLQQLADVLRRRRQALTVLVGDATRVFLSAHGIDWYRRRGIELRALQPTALLALTVNPIAPQSHRFDSRELRALLAQAIPDLPIIDVRHEDYGAPLRQ